MVRLQELIGDDAGCSSSHFQKTVMLREWWLIKCPDEFEGKRFGVAGTERLASTERQAMRVFTSAPIVKAFDVWTLETSDGICILLKGLINKERTAKAGFTTEIFHHFIFGFPPSWDEVISKCFKGETCCGAGIDSVPMRIDSGCPILTPCKKEDISIESKSNNVAGETNSAETIGDGSDELAVLPEHSGDKSGKTQRRDTKRAVTSEKVNKAVQSAARKSLRLQLKADGNSTESNEDAIDEDVAGGARTKRRIDFDTQVTPVKEKSEEVSPESSSIKRSRSGRALVSTLEFWRNQVAIYNKGGKMIGIKEGGDGTSRGTDGRNRV